MYLHKAKLKEKLAESWRLKMFKEVFISLLLPALGVMSQAASAATVTFDFTGDDLAGFTSGSLSFMGSDGSTTLVASAGNNGNGHISYLKDSSWGLQVCTRALPQTSASCVSPVNGNHQSDDGSNNNDSDPAEYIQLDFDNSISLVSASFDGSSSGEFDLYADGTRVLNEMLVGGSVSLAGIDGSMFRFLANGEGDDFKLQTLAIEVSDVPLPAAAWLFGSALLGLGVVSRTERNTPKDSV